MKKILFLCTSNSCRSQMAEGFARELGNGLVEAHSAGLSPSQVNPNAVRAMQEVGVDISHRTSKSIDVATLGRMDVIITLCGHAEAMCPMTPPGIRRIHWPIDDPVDATGTEEEIMHAFRRARDEIREKITEFIKICEQEREPA